jgi:hypothetical protein
LIRVELAPEVTASLRGVCTAPYSTYVRGVIIDGDRGVLLTGSGGSALVIGG